MITIWPSSHADTTVRPSGKNAHHVALNYKQVQPVQMGWILDKDESVFVEDYQFQNPIYARSRPGMHLQASWHLGRMKQFLPITVIGEVKKTNPI